MNQMPPPESPASSSAAGPPTAQQVTTASLYQVPYGNPAAMAYGNASSEPSTPTTLIQHYPGAYGLCPEFNMFWNSWNPFVPADVLHSDPAATASCSTDASAVFQHLNFASRLNPITPTGTGPNPYATAPQHHFAMPGQNMAATNGGVPYGNASLGRNGYASGAGTPRPSSGGGKRTGGRRPKEYEDFSDILNEEDRDKRDKRRQRNKEAAARCRQRRLDLMSTLQSEVDQLKSRNAQNEMLIEQLKIQRDSLIRELNTHGCKIPSSVASIDSLAQAASLSYPATVSSSQPQSTSQHQTSQVGLKRPHPDQNIYTVPLTSIKSEIDSDYVPSSAISSNGVSTAGSMLPPPLNKIPKIQNQNQPPQTRASGQSEPTLTQVNAPSNNDLQRPDSLAIGGSSTCDSGFDESKWSGMPSITTPTSLMTDGTYPFLYTDTGLTPVSAQPALPVCSLGTPTPLGENELRSL